MSQYGTKFVPVPVRDSTYVLGEIYNNETELPPKVKKLEQGFAAGVIRQASPNLQLAYRHFLPHTQH